MADVTPIIRASTIEVWRDIPGFEGFYQASDQGRIRSVDRIDTVGRRLHGKLMSLKAAWRGYPTILLSKDGRAKRLFVHRAVAMTFLPNPQNLAEVNHIDGNISNASLINLEWCTRSENHLHAYRVLGRKPTKTRAVVGRRGNHIVRLEKLRDAVRHGFDPCGVGQCARGKQQLHRGYTWSYDNS